MPLFPLTAGLKALGPTIGFIYGFQAACASLAVPKKTEKYYDLCGSLGFISAAGFSLYWPSLRAKFLLGSKAALPALTAFHPRQLLMSGMTLFWAGRLGSFLFQVGNDMYGMRQIGMTLADMAPIRLRSESKKKERTLVSTVSGRTHRNSLALG